MLPSVCKVIMVLGGQVCFFGASWAAEKYFKIERTGQAFYILGSVFLFLTILAAGYFGQLGQVILKGRKPLPCPAGRQYSHGDSSFSKIRRFHNKVYAGLPVGNDGQHVLLMGALKLNGRIA